ncbi:MAG TPA: CerR family C-terminal domain-containing protein [Gemmataceae bacterium]|nr:CerR family C-terminal domain-containing protein [Gemmataceae bacterium]
MSRRTRNTLRIPEQLRVPHEEPPPSAPLLNSPERLLEAAGEIFAEKGFKGATIREIIDRAGVNIAAVNYYFRDKERLYIETVKQAVCFRPETRPSWPSATPPTVKLHDFIHFLVGRLLDKNKPAWHARLVMREMAQPSEACTELVRDYIEPMSEILQGILRELLPPDTPRWKRLMTGFSIVGQCVHYCSHKPVITLLVGEKDCKYFEPATLADHITQFSLNSLTRT